MDFPLLGSQYEYMSKPEYCLNLKEKASNPNPTTTIVCSARIGTSLTNTISIAPRNNMDKIDHALETIKSYGIQNVLALRGDPPYGQDKFVKVDGGFARALDLVSHMRSKYKDCFGITVAGYPEAHPDAIESNGLATEESYASDLAYLKKKWRHSIMLQQMAILWLQDSLGEIKLESNSQFSIWRG